MEELSGGRGQGLSSSTWGVECVVNSCGLRFSVVSVFGKKASKRAFVHHGYSGLLLLHLGCPVGGVNAGPRCTGVSTQEYQCGDRLQVSTHAPGTSALLRWCHTTSTARPSSTWACLCPITAVCGQSMCTRTLPPRP